MRNISISGLRLGPLGTRRFSISRGRGASTQAPLCALLAHIQSGAAYHSPGFEDENLGSSPGCWAATVATYCPSRPEELP